MPLSALIALTLAAATQPPHTRFQPRCLLPGNPAITVDAYQTGLGFAPAIAARYGLQARILWIDGTANLDAVNTTQKIQALMAKIAESGFNTVVFDVKPISGQTLYPSRFAPKIESWRGQTLPQDFDPLAAMVPAAHARGLTLLVSMNAFSEGHSMFRVGPGYQHPDWQSVLYVPVSTVTGSSGATFDLHDALDPGTVPQDQLAAYDRVPHQTLSGVVLDDKNVVIGPWPGTDLPDGGTILLGNGPGAQFLKDHAYPGVPIGFGTRPTFVRMDRLDHPQYPLMVNPNNPDVQSRELAILQEVVSRYAVDGVVYDDRLRYANLEADFSPLTQQAFEKYVGHKLNWPQDVLTFTTTDRLGHGILPGPYYDEWMAWRAGVLRSYLVRAKSVIKTARPGAILGVYAGSWYGEYPALGANWAAPQFDAGFWFLTPEYRKTGFGNVIDLLIPGCYYGAATVHEALKEDQPIGSTIEQAGDLASVAVHDQAWTCAGIDSQPFLNDPVRLIRALQAASATGEGVMVFDLSHGVDQLWDTFSQAFQAKRKSPFASRTALDQIRRLRAAYDKAGKPQPPAIIAAGSSGVGQ